MGDDGRVVGDPTEVLTRSGGSSYVSLSVDVPTTGVGSEPMSEAGNETATVASQPVTPAPPKRRLRFIGWLALATAVIAAVLTGVGVGLAADGAFVTGTSLAWAAIVVSGVAVVGGILAVIAGFGRVPGAIAIVLGLIANPFLLTQLLSAVSAAVT